MKKLLLLIPLYISLSLSASETNAPKSYVSKKYRDRLLNQFNQIPEDDWLNISQKYSYTKAEIDKIKKEFRANATITFPKTIKDLDALGKEGLDAIISKYNQRLENNRQRRKNTFNLVTPKTRKYTWNHYTTTSSRSNLSSPPQERNRISIQQLLN